MPITTDTRGAKAAFFVLMACGPGQHAMAHSAIIMPPPYAVVDSSVTAAYRIVHGCDGAPVIAMSLIMPSTNPVLKRQGGGAIPDIDKDGKRDLFDILETGSLVGSFQPVIDRAVFNRFYLSIDSPDLGNPVGVGATQGSVPEKFNGETRFTVYPVFFQALSCARGLIVHPVGADICKITRDPKEGEVNIWMEHTTPKFPHPVHGVGENSLQISFKRDLVANPLKPRCGEGFVVDVYASDEDIDAHLPITGVWPKP